MLRGLPVRQKLPTTPPISSETLVRRPNTGNSLETQEMSTWACKRGMSILTGRLPGFQVLQTHFCSGVRMSCWRRSLSSHLLSAPDDLRTRPGDRACGFGDSQLDRQALLRSDRLGGSCGKPTIALGTCQAVFREGVSLSFPKPFGEGEAGEEQ